MKNQVVREKIAEIATIDGCEISNAEIDRLEGVWNLGYNTPMPGWVFEMLRTETIDQRVYKLGQMTRRYMIRSALCVGRTKIIKK